MTTFDMTLDRSAMPAYRWVRLDYTNTVQEVATQRWESAGKGHGRGWIDLHAVRDRAEAAYLAGEMTDITGQLHAYRRDWIDGDSGREPVFKVVPVQEIR